MTLNAALARLALLLAAACTPSPTPSLAVVNVTIIDTEHGTLLPTRTVLVQGRRVLRVDSGSAEPLPRGTRVVDGTGRFLIPGLWDMHVHLAGNDRAPTRMLAWGITGARDMGGDLEQIVTLRARIAAGRVRGPRLIIAGPALAGPKSPAAAGLGLVRTPEQAAVVVDSIAKRRVDFIKVHEDLSRETWFAISRAARAHHLILVGHVPASLSPEEASDSDLHSIEHFEFLPDRCLVLLDSTTRANHSMPPRFSAGESLHDELELLVAAGFSSAAVLRAATYNPAVFLALTDSLGTVKPGYVADLVVLDANPLQDIGNTRRIAAVIRDGTLLTREVLVDLRRGGPDSS